MTLSRRAARNFLTLCILSFLLTGNSSALPAALPRDFSSVALEWKNADENAFIQTAEYSERKLVIHCAKIDLTAPGLSVKMLPQTEKSDDVFFAEDFCKKAGAVLAFNTTPFYVRESGGKKRHTSAGLCVNDGAVLSRPLGGYCALAFFGFEDGANASERRAKIFSSQKDKDISRARFASGGFWQILKDKKKMTFKPLRDSRTAAGLDAEGKTLYVIAVEGENPSRSAGLTYMECADFFLALGCENAMQFDGGSSTQLCANGKSLLGYKNYVKVPALLAFAFE